MHLSRVLISNRGEIAVRLIRACQKLSIVAIAVYVPEDAGALYVRQADEAYCLDCDGSRGFLDVDALVRICLQHEVQAVIPGYGFLSEDARFVRALQAAGILFVGPSAETLEQFGLKHSARKLAVQAGVPVVPGSAIFQNWEQAEEVARRLGFPIMVKATAGGGGMGLQKCHDMAELRVAIEAVKSRGDALFKNAAFFLEKYIETGHHIETQIFGNGQGDVLFLGERECSVQRRHQKVIEESPSPFVLLRHGLRQKLKECSVSLAASVEYKSAGTVEFLVDHDTGEFYFLEMNTRLQVEHGVTELCYDVDLVEMMLLQADAELSGQAGLLGAHLQKYARDEPIGHAIEARVYAENPAKGFSPSPGFLQSVCLPREPSIRVDTWVETGSAISPSFDPLLSKIISYAHDRSAAINQMCDYLRKITLQGPTLNIDFLLAILQSEDFISGFTTTTMLATGFTYQPAAMEFLEPGAFTTVQDYPGRMNVPNGVPRSGPMDSVSFRVSNLLVGNDEGTEGFEITLFGPRIKFYSTAAIALCGAAFSMTIDGRPVDTWARHIVKAGSEVVIGESTFGARAYLSIRGGLPDVSLYLGSKSTTPGLNWGGYQGRCLRAGDFLGLDPNASIEADSMEAYSLPKLLIPPISEAPRLYALPGPWFSDEFVTPAGQQALFNTKWTYSYSSGRSGIRLEGPAPSWARNDGGEGGSHPSNMVGYGCPLGGVSFTGDTGVILPMDGPNQTGKQLQSDTENYQSG